MLISSVAHTNESICVFQQLEEEEEPLDLSWPSGWRSRISYILLAPLIFPLWITLPDVRRQVGIPSKRLEKID